MNDFLEKTRKLLDAAAMKLSYVAERYHFQIVAVELFLSSGALLLEIFVSDRSYGTYVKSFLLIMLSAIFIAKLFIDWRNRDIDRFFPLPPPKRDGMLVQHIQDVTSSTKCNVTLVADDQTFWRFMKLENIIFPSMQYPEGSPRSFSDSQKIRMFRDFLAAERIVCSIVQIQAGVDQGIIWCVPISANFFEKYTNGSARAYDLQLSDTQTWEDAQYILVGAIGFLNAGKVDIRFVTQSLLLLCKICRVDHVKVEFVSAAGDSCRARYLDFIGATRAGGSLAGRDVYVFKLGAEWAM